MALFEWMSASEDAAIQATGEHDDDRPARREEPPNDETDADESEEDEEDVEDEEEEAAATAEHSSPQNALEKARLSAAGTPLRVGSDGSNPGF